MEKAHHTPGGGDVKVRGYQILGKRKVMNFDIWFIVFLKF